MKLRLLYLLPLFAVFAAGCLHQNKNSTNVNPIPDGNYTGQFMRVHTHKDQTKDTLKANIALSLSNSAGTYKVTGDTATIHAGSYGNYAGSSATMSVTFYDKTYSSSAPVTKSHLTGTYNYAYDGTVFQLKAFGPLDTLAFLYDLKKVSN